ncbi:MAG TPA: hypothetical protein VJZ76_14330 [Thermoanaerobaculia bacterium]|nr:hypothetical protein [Thermoanaerobaculia bacterium]
MRLFALLPALAAVSAMAVEIPVSEPVYGPAPGNQYYAAAASDGEQYLAVWVDERAEAGQSYATRIAADGTLLDPNGIRVASGGLTYYPSVLWGGSAWFVLSNTCSAIELVRVGRNGVTLDAKPRLFSVNAWCPGVSAASDGRYVAVGYVTGYSKYEQRALILDADGQQVADLLLFSGDENVSPAITADGTSFVAVVKNQALRFDRNGPLGAARSISIEGSANPAMGIASDGKEFLITRGGLAFWMSADLVTQFRMQLPFSQVQSLFWTGSNYVISGVMPFYENGHENRGRIGIVLLDRDGRLVAQREMQSSGNGANPPNGAAVAGNGRNLLVAWNEPSEAHVVPYTEDDTYASIVSLPDLTPAPRRLLSFSAGSQFRPVTAAGPDNSLTVWQESSGVYARRHWRGGRTDPAPLRLTSALTSAAVVFNGSDFIVATTEGHAVVTRRVPAAGELRIEGEGHFDAEDPEYVELASDGTTTLAAWFDGGVYAARVGADGAAIDKTALQVAPYSLADTTHRISVAPDRSGTFLVIWGGSLPACYCSPPTPAAGGTLRGARVTSALTLLDHPPIDVTKVIGVFDSHSDPGSRLYDPQHSVMADAPSVTWNGSEWLVVWNRAYRASSANLGTKEEIRGRRIARNGTLLDGAPSDPGILIAQDAFAPTVAWSGSGYLLAWYSGVPTYRGYSFSRTLASLHAASFDHLGGALANERTLGESPQTDPISISIASGVTTLAYVRLGDDQRFGGVPRAFLETPIAARRRAAGR